MRLLWRWAIRAILAVALLVIGLLAPIVYIETACTGTPLQNDYVSVLDVKHHRAESRTLMTYPEWHIVHAYEDYAHVLGSGDPHDFGYLRSIGEFWSSLCALSKASQSHGGVDAGTKQMVYVIGASFSLELLLKAAYEETLGRVSVYLRGEQPSPADALSAAQAADYAAFLQQVPWYKWDFGKDAQALSVLSQKTLRDQERALALGLEYRAKAAYAGVIAAAVENVGADALTLHMIVRGLESQQLSAFQDVRIIAETAQGVIIETPRYRKLTVLLQAMAKEGAEFIEIAGNDDILFTALSEQPSHPQALFSFSRQGFADHRHLILVKVSSLAETLRGLEGQALRLEHIHDY